MIWFLIIRSQDTHFCAHKQFINFALFVGDATYNKKFFIEFFDMHLFIIHFSIEPKNYKERGKIIPPPWVFFTFFKVYN